MNRTRDENRLPPFIMSPECAALMDELRKLKIGDVAEWESLKAQRGIDYQRRNYLVQTARRRLAVENIHFAVIAGLGIKILTKEEAVEYCQGRREMAGRHIKRTARTLTTISADELDGDGQKALLRERIMTGALLKVSRAKPDQIMRIGEGKAPSIPSLLEALAKKNGDSE